MKTFTQDLIRCEEVIACPFIAFILKDTLVRFVPGNNRRVLSVSYYVLAGGYASFPLPGIRCSRPPRPSFSSTFIPGPSLLSPQTTAPHFRLLSNVA